MALLMKKVHPEARQYLPEVPYGSMGLIPEMKLKEPEDQNCLSFKQMCPGQPLSAKFGAY
jgi:hypothetical protein